MPFVESRGNRWRRMERLLGGSQRRVVGELREYHMGSWVQRCVEGRVRELHSRYTAATQGVCCQIGLVGISCWHSLHNLRFA
jgi:hypothetical protein